MPQLSILATLAGEDRIISDDGALPWRIAEDDKYFTSIIKNQTVIAGRKMFESNARDISKARNRIVLTKNVGFSHQGITTAYSPEDALQKAQDYGALEVFIIGGGEIFKTFLPRASTLYLTVIDRDIQGDMTFPGCSGFKVESEEEKRIGRNVLTFIELKRG